MKKVKNVDVSTLLNVQSLLLFHNPLLYLSRTGIELVLLFIFLRRRKKQGVAYPKFICSKSKSNSGNPSLHSP